MLVLPSSVQGQEVSPLSAADSAAIWIAALDTVRQEMWKPFQAEEVLWLSPSMSASTSPEVLSALRVRFPNVRPTDPSEEIEDLFDCPPGSRVQMPLRGCPIRDGGRIIGLTYLEGADEIRVMLSVIHSDEAGEWTQRLSREVFLARDERRGWKVQRLGLTMVT